MKEFEKWWDINGNQPESRFEPEDWFIAEAGWKAALERLYEELGYYEDDERIKDWIQKELGL